MRTDPWYPLRYELARSRRYEKDFVLAAGHVGGERGSARRTKNAVEAYSRVVRDTDAVWEHRGRLYILLAETSIDAASEVVERLGQSLEEELRIRDLQMAAFPDDGVTTAALITATEKQDAPAPVAAPGASVRMSHGSPA